MSEPTKPDAAGQRASAGAAAGPGAGAGAEAGARARAGASAGTGAGAGAPAAGEPPRLELSIEEFQRLELKVGTVRSAEPHPNADRLVVLAVDVGEAEPRTLVAGIRTAYDPATLVGRQVVVVANLKPAKLRGIESRGMVLAASDASGLALVAPDRAITPGSRVK